MNKPVVKVENLSKRYNLGELHQQTNSFRDKVTSFFKKDGYSKNEETIWALKDISFEVKQREILGIIGCNGGGKSTLLKILSRITKPTKGQAFINGRVGSLLEVGTGFHPELTGRENIYLNGSILGMKRVEIGKKFDEIVAFAEIDRFINTPVKRYSSGMYVRLAFSVAAHMQPEILLVDEVLAVGDLAFQKKCLEKIQDVVEREGRTVLFVSHNIWQVERICTRGILLDQGKIIADGRANEVCNRFFQLSNEKIQSYLNEQYETKKNIQTSGEVEIRHIDILDANSRSIDQIESGGMLRVLVCFNVIKSIKKPEIVIGTHTTDFVYLSASSTSVIDDRPDFEVGLHDVEYIVPSFPLVAGAYCIRVAFFDQNRRLMFSGDTLKMFSVVSANDETKEPGLRTLNFPTIWKIGNQTYSKDIAFSTSVEPN